MRQELEPDSLISTANSRSRGRWRRNLSRAQHWRCHWCRQTMRFEVGYMNTATIEHMVPVSRGGTNCLWNLSAACYRCNSSRGKIDMHEFELISKKYKPDSRAIEEVVSLRRSSKRDCHLPKHRWPLGFDLIVSLVYNSALVLGFR